MCVRVRKPPYGRIDQLEILRYPLVQLRRRPHDEVDILLPRASRSRALADERRRVFGFGRRFGRMLDK